MNKQAVTLMGAVVGHRSQNDSHLYIAQCRIITHNVQDPNDGEKWRRRSFKGWGLPKNVRRYTLRENHDALKNTDVWLRGCKSLMGS